MCIRDSARSDRPAILVRSRCRLEDVTDAAHRMDERFVTRVDLLAQVADVQLDDMGLSAEVVVPDPVEDLRLAQYPAWVAHQEAKQLELGGGQLDQLTV